ncbi:MAG: alpha/beta fold hydrolase [Proteobacteria bacterium]|nr:alpha/beta fold hydrolase [Pseudomonadota bacterium]
MTANKVFRFAPSPEHKAKHLFVFLHGGGATPESMISVAFKFQARFPSAALVVPSRLEDLPGSDPAPDPLTVLNDGNRVERIAALLPRIEDLVRREQTNCGIAAESTVLIGFSQGGTVALEAVKRYPGLAGAVVAYSARFAQLPLAGASISARFHLVHGEYDAIVSRVHSERAARALAALHVPVTLDIVADLGHALSHHAVSLGSLRLLQGIYEGRKATLH